MSFTAVITANVSDFEKGIQEAKKSVNGLEKNVDSKLQSVGSKFTDLGNKVKFVSAAFLAAGAASFKMAADFQDAIGATDQIFKSNSKAVQDWAKNLPSMYGIATKEALEYSNKMATMLVNIGGLTEEQAGKQSASLIELAGDLTAMFGGETKDAVWTLTAALKGNNAMLDNYGIAANDALIKARAFEMGLVEQGKEMSLTAKQAATLSIIYEQTAAAQGQAAREADGASGVMRALGVEFKNLSTELGTKLLPIFTPMLAGLRDLVANLRGLSPEVVTAGLVFGGLVVAAAPLLLMIGKIITLLPIMTIGLNAVKGALASLLSPVGLVVIAITALTIGLVAYSNRTIEAKNSTEALAQVNKEAIKSISTEIAKLEYLVKIAKDEKESKDRRFDAISQINKISPEYLKNLTLENIGTDAAKKSIEQYTTALKENAREKAIGLKLSKLESDLIEQQAKIIDIDNNPKFQGDDVLSKSARADAWIVPMNKIIKIQKQISLYEQLVKAKAATTTTTTDTESDEVKALNAQIALLEAQLKTTNTEAVKLKDIDAFSKLVGDGGNLNAIVAKTVEQIQLMTARLEGLQSGTIKVKNVKSEIEKTEKTVKELTTAFETLTGKAGEWATASLGALETPKLGFGDGGLIPAPSFDLEAASKTLTDLGNFRAKVADNFVELGNLASSGLGAFADAIGNALGGGNFDDLGGELISALGSLAQQFGGMLISFGLASKQLQLLITNPVAAIAAGVALVALGAAAKASATKMVSNATSGGSYSTGGTSSYQTATTLGTSDYRGQYKDDYTVNFKIGTNELVGVLEMANQRKKRL